MLTQSLGIIERTRTIEKKKNLENPNNLLVEFCSNGKENMEMMGNIFNACFEMNNDAWVIVSILKGETCDNASQFELHAVKFLCSTHERN